jgi:hypothetical protein
VIVIFAREDDRHAATVAGILARDHDEEVTIFDLSLFPGSVRLSCSFSAQDGGCRFVDRDNRRIDFGSVKSFWWRRPQSLHPDPRIADANVQNFALHESLSALYGMLRCCPGLWVNDIENDQNADYKPRQLATVRRHGLPVADTLITNDPAEARAFFERHGGDVVYKAFNQRGIIWLPTRRLTADDLIHLDSLQCAPVIFQRYVEGTRDIRVTVVGQSAFATEILIEDPDCIDHRLVLTTAPCRPHQLPPEIERKVLDLVRDLKLEYGCVDLRVTPEGEYFFFEINTAGEFLYLEDRSGQPIAAAVAAHLASGRPACSGAPVNGATIFDPL